MSPTVGQEYLSEIEYTAKVIQFTRRNIFLLALILGLLRLSSQRTSRANETCNNEEREAATRKQTHSCEHTDPWNVHGTSATPTYLGAMPVPVTVKKHPPAVYTPPTSSFAGGKTGTFIFASTSGGDRLLQAHYDAVIKPLLERSDAHNAVTRSSPSGEIWPYGSMGQRRSLCSSRLNSV